MNEVHVWRVAFIALFLCGTSWAHQRAVSEISEGTIRTVYIKKPVVGAKGYVVEDWENGQVRVEFLLRTQFNDALIASRGYLDLTMR